MFLRRRNKKVLPAHSPRALERASRAAVEPLEDRLLLSTSGLTGSYFANANLSGTPVGTRNDKTIDFKWSSGSGPGS